MTEQENALHLERFSHSRAFARSMRGGFLQGKPLPGRISAHCYWKNRFICRENANSHKYFLLGVKP
jgi:hypothetical protein